MKILKKIFFLFLILFQNISSDTISFNQITGSPFATNENAAEAIAFTPQLSTGNVFVGVLNFFSHNIDVFKINISTGQPTAVPGSPFPTASSGQDIAFTQELSSGNVFAAVTNTNNTIDVYSVNKSTGVFTTISNMSFASLNGVFGIEFTQEFSPGVIYAGIANVSTNTISIFSVNINTGAFTEVAGSPFATGDINPNLFSFTQKLSTGNVFVAVANFGGTKVSVYELNISTGFLTPVTGSPFSAGPNPLGVDFTQELSTGNVFSGVVLNGSNFVNAYQVDKTTGIFTSAGSFATGNSPQVINFTQQLFSGNIYAQVTNANDNTVSVYQVDTTSGTFTPITGSPFPTGRLPFIIDSTQQLSTGNVFAGIVNGGDNTFGIYKFTFITITTPTNGQTITNAMPTFSGRTQADNTVTVFVDGNNAGTTTADSSTGNWSFTVPSTLSQGAHTLSVTTTDGSGNTADAGPVSFNIDSTTFVTITFPTNGQTINNARPTFTGTTEVGDTVTVSVDGGAAQSATVDGSGNWSFAQPTSLSMGSHTVQAFAVDQFGNMASSHVVNFTVDTSTFVTITTPANMSTVKTARPIISGTKESGDSVQLTVTNSDGVVVIDINIPADASENWSFAPTSNLAQDTYTITAIATDPVGNTASATSTFTIVLCTDIFDSLTLAIRQKYGIN